MGTSAKILMKQTADQDKKEFNVCKVKSIDSYVGSRKFSEELKKKASVTTRLSSKESIDDRLMVMRAVSSSCIECDNQDLKINHFQSVQLE